MLGKILTWSILAFGVTTSIYLDVALAKQPELLWLPLLNLAGFATLSGWLIEN